MLREFLGEDCLLAHFRASSKKQVLQNLAEHLAAKLNIDAKLVFKGLLDREKLGSTAVGHGVAIPHCRVDGVDELSGMFAQLDSPVAFDAPDGEPVDLVFVLIAPKDANSAHIQALSKIARLMRRADLRNRLRDCNCVKEITETIRPALGTAA